MNPIVSAFLYPIVIIVICLISWGLFCLVAKMNEFITGEKNKPTTFGAIMSFLIVVGTIAALCFVFDFLGGDYDLSAPFRM